ncbi:tyrosine-type recombinase/integrase [Streptosporangium longisporum]|uniref:tyrosine-type recombinase/integrase n=1 Tax=Streptosporangium longisporum TaxID=46187 RepID=UPI003CD0889D
MSSCHLATSTGSPAGPDCLTAAPPSCSTTPQLACRTGRGPCISWTLHQLRHSALTHAAEDGVNTSTLSAYSGHTSVASLARYACLSFEALARQQAGRDPPPLTGNQATCEKRARASRELPAERMNRTSSPHHGPLIMGAPDVDPSSPPGTLDSPPRR